MGGILQTAFRPRRQEPCLVKRDIAYVKEGHPRQVFDLYLPKRPGLHPLVIYIHGGGFRMGSKGDPGVPCWLTAQGFAVAALDYRFSSDAIFPAQLDDCLAAVRTLRKYHKAFQVDPARFIVWGESSGAHLASLIGLAASSPHFDVLENRVASPVVQGVIDFGGCSDLLKIDDQASPGSPKASAPDSFESMLVGGPLPRHTGLATLASPMHYVRHKPCPFFVAHGEMDRSVPIAQSRILVEALRKAGGYVEYHPLAGADQAFRGASQKDLEKLEEGVVRFLQLVRSGQLEN